MSVSPQVGEVAPELVGIDHDGNPWKLSDHAGHPVVLIFHRHLA